MRIDTSHGLNSIESYEVPHREGSTHDLQCLLYSLEHQRPVDNGNGS